MPGIKPRPVCARQMSYRFHLPLPFLIGSKIVVDVHTLICGVEVKEEEPTIFWEMVYSKVILEEGL